MRNLFTVISASPFITFHYKCFSRLQLAFVVIKKFRIQANKKLPKWFFSGNKNCCVPFVHEYNKIYFPRVNDDEIMTFKNIILWVTHFVFSCGSRDFLTINSSRAHGSAGYLWKAENSMTTEMRKFLNFPPALTLFTSFCLSLREKSRAACWIIFNNFYLISK